MENTLHTPMALPHAWQTLQRPLQQGWQRLRSYLARHLAASPVPTPAQPIPQAPAQSQAPQGQGRSWQGPVRAQPAGRYTQPPRPLRRHQANGRLVLAGRMADVCAELERLAALEPQT